MSSPQSVLYHLDSLMREVLNSVRDPENGADILDSMKAVRGDMLDLQRRIEGIEDLLKLIVKLLGEKKK